MTKLEHLKPSCSGDISLLVCKCEAAVLFGQKKKCIFHHQNTHTSCLYFDIKFSELEKS